jgi:hypothetical protein
MSQVQIVPNPTTGSLITPFENKPDYGYLQLSQTSLITEGIWVRERKRSTLLRAKCDVLERFVRLNKTLSLTGNIVVKEYVESQVPEDIYQQFANKSLPVSEALDSYVKRAGQDGIELCVDGERIMRFSVYDPSGKDTDIHVQHNNTDAVREFNAVRNAKNASL